MAGTTTYLPAPPSDEEKYSYFRERPLRWPFIWLFVGQVGTVFGYTMVMRKSPDTSLGLICLTFMVPPIVVNLWLRIRRPRTMRIDHDRISADWTAEMAGHHTPWPSADIFLPSCGEPLDVLDNTFRYVSQIQWRGRLTIYVLDDAHSAAVADLASTYGFEYIARPNKGEWKKAGNLIYAFDHSDGDFIAVFDADFVPREDFLYEVMPYMQDPAIGIVQTAQYFDVDDCPTYFAKYAGTLQELFFRWIQPARDTYEAAICAGTNLVYRREAVVAAGGFAKVPLGEDVHSGVKLWVANFRTRYVPIVLAKGLAPDTWRALTNQQYRWCRSSMLLMVSQFFKDAPFSKQQRVCFWAAFLYYMSSAAMILTGVLPTLFMVWVFPEQIHWWNYLVMLPSFLSTFFVLPRLARGWDIFIYRVCTINSFCHVLAVVDALRQKVQAWVPTGAANAPASAPKKGSADVPRRVAYMLRTWVAVVQILLWVGIVRDIQLGKAAAVVFLPATCLGLLQLYMLLPLIWHSRYKEPQIAVASSANVLALPERELVAEAAS
jgi:cellulose synthase (UDP-forming)